MTKQAKEKYFLFILLVLSALFPVMALASVESSLMSVQDKLTGVILPTFSVIGIGFAGFSFLTGHENAKRHIWYAVIGTAIGFGAQVIVNFIAGMVH